MPSSLGIKRAPFLVLGNFIRNLGLQKGNKGTTGHPSYSPHKPKTLNELSVKP